MADKICGYKRTGEQVSAKTIREAITALPDGFSLDGPGDYTRSTIRLSSDLADKVQAIADRSGISQCEAISKIAVMGLGGARGCDDTNSTTQTP